MICESKSCNICCMMYVVTIYMYLCKHNIKPVLANISKQSIQSCPPLNKTNKQFAPGLQSDLKTR